MLWLGLLAALAETSSAGASLAHTASTTTTTTSDLEVPEAPLSLEELELLRSLTTTTSTRVARPPLLPTRPTVHGEILLPRVALRGLVPRSAAEAFEGRTTLVDTAERALGRASAVLRGQTGHRVAVLLDDIPLLHPLSSSRDTSGWHWVEPLGLEAGQVTLNGGLDLAPEASAGVLHLSTRPPPPEGRSVELTALTRSGDRSLGIFGRLGLASGPVGAAAAAGYAVHRALRVATPTVGVDRGEPYDRATGSLRLRLGGLGPVTLEGGAGYERLAGASLTEAHLLVFARGRLEVEGYSGALTAAYQRFSRDESSEESRAGALFVQGIGEAPLGELLRLQLGGRLELGEAEVAARAGERLSAGAHAGLALRSEGVAADLVVALLHGKSTAGAEAVELTTALVQAGVHAALWGPLGLRAGLSRNAYVPTVRDLLDANAPLSPEESLSLALGPTLSFGTGRVEAAMFFTRLSSALEPAGLASGRLANIALVHLLGAELAGEVALGPRLAVLLCVSWAEGREPRTGASVSTIPSVSGRAALRYDLGARGAYLEARARVVSAPLSVFAAPVAAPPVSLGVRAPSDFVRFGLSGGAELLAGLRLAVTVENLLDTPYREPGSLIPGAGVDVRAALTWSDGQ